MEALTHRQLIWELFRVHEAIAIEHDLMPGLIVAGGRRKSETICKARDQFITRVQAEFVQHRVNKSTRWAKLGPGEAATNGYKPLSTTTIADYLGMKDHTAIVSSKKHQFRKWRNGQ